MIRTTEMNWVQSLTVFTMIAFVAMQPAMAQQNTSVGPDANDGRSIAMRLCAGCHLVSSSQKGEVTAGVPSFDLIANKPDQTADRILSILIVPHPPMPSIQLDRQEIANLIAYFATLRKPEAGPPLLKPRQQKQKPKYPKPS